jgi:hypothetical protein
LYRMCDTRSNYKSIALGVEGSAFGSIMLRSVPKSPGIFCTVKRSIHDSNHISALGDWTVTNVLEVSLEIVL